MCILACVTVTVTRRQISHCLQLIDGVRTARWLRISLWVNLADKKWLFNLYLLSVLGEDKSGANSVQPAALKSRINIDA